MEGSTQGEAFVTAHCAVYNKYGERRQIWAMRRKEEKKKKKKEEMAQATFAKD